MKQEIDETWIFWQSVPTARGYVRVDEDQQKVHIFELLSTSTTFDHHFYVSDAKGKVLYGEKINMRHMEVSPAPQQQNNNAMDQDNDENKGQDNDDNKGQDNDDNKGQDNDDNGDDPESEQDRIKLKLCGWPDCIGLMQPVHLNDELKKTGFNRIYCDICLTLIMYNKPLWVCIAGRTNHHPSGYHACWACQKGDRPPIIYKDIKDLGKRFYK